LKFSVNRAPSLKYTSKFHSLFSFFFFIPFRLRNGIFNYSRDTRLYRCLTLYSIDMSTAYIHRRNQIRTFCHASVYPQNFEIVKFSRQMDCYHVLFISRWFVWYRHAFRKLSVGFEQQSLKWLKYVHFNRIFRHVSRERVALLPQM